MNKGSFKRLKRVIGARKWTIFLLPLLSVPAELIADMISGGTFDWPQVMIYYLGFFGSLVFYFMHKEGGAG